MAASFSSDFIVGGKTFTVLTCDYSLSQPTDPRGRPSAGVRGGLIRVTLTGNDYAVLTNWAVDPFKALDGEIRFRNMDGGTMKVVKFKQTYCVSYREIFTPHDGVTAAYSFDLGLTAAKLFIGVTMHDNQWLDWKRS